MDEDNVIDTGPDCPTSQVLEDPQEIQEVEGAGDAAEEADKEFDEEPNHPVDQGSEDPLEAQVEGAGDAGGETGNEVLHMDMEPEEVADITENVESCETTAGAAPPLEEAAVEEVKLNTPVTPNATQESKPGKLDPYFYTNQDHFTSEIFKIELRRLPKFYGLGELKKLLNVTLKLDSNKVKPTSGISNTSVFVCFRNEASKQSGLQILNGYKWKGSVLEAFEARPAKDPLMLKRKKDAVKNEGEKQPKLDDEALLETFKTKLKDSTTPYWKIPYEEQIQKKTTAIRNSLKAYAKQLARGPLELWVSQEVMLNRGIPCPMDPFLTIKNTTGYRNRCEFTIGLHPIWQERVVGFRIGAYNKGNCSVLPADECLHVSDVAKECARVFQKFVVSSEFEPHDPINRVGHFKTLNVLNTSTGQLMVTLDFVTTGLTEEEVAKVREEYKEFFVSGPGKELGVNSLNFRQLDAQLKRGEVFKSADNICGDKFIIEKLLGYEFQISPQSFFQVNTEGAGILYSTIAELADPDAQTTLLDICCGTGTIGISMAKKAGQVLGLELVKESVESAKQNAIRNGVADTCNFFTGDVQDALQPTIVRAKYDKIVAVLDPPRPGVGAATLNMIRACWKIKRLVFVACNLSASYLNLVHLGKPASKATPGDPFIPVRVVPIDMFPHTSHFEVVILLERRSLTSLQVPKPIPVSVSEHKGQTPHKKPQQQKQRFQQPPPQSYEGTYDETGGAEMVDDEMYDDSEYLKLDDSGEFDENEVYDEELQEAFQIAEAYENPVVNNTAGGPKRNAPKYHWPEDVYKNAMDQFGVPTFVELVAMNPGFSKSSLRYKLRKMKSEAMEAYLGQSQTVQFTRRGNIKLPAKQGMAVTKSPWKKGPNFPSPSNSLGAMQQNPFNTAQCMPSTFASSSKQFVTQMHQDTEPAPYTMPYNQVQKAAWQQRQMTPQAQLMPPRPVLREVSTQTDCKEFMTSEELDEAERLGLTWGNRVSDGALNDYRNMRKEEEEAVQRFREGFLSALRLKQKRLLTEIGRSGSRKEMWDDSQRYSSWESSSSQKRSRSPSLRRDYYNDDYQNRRDPPAERPGRDYSGDRYERRQESSSERYESISLRKPSAQKHFPEEPWKSSGSSPPPPAPKIGDQRNKYAGGGSSYSSMSTATSSTFKPNTAYQNTSTSYQNTGTSYQNPGGSYQNSSSSYLKPGTSFQKPGGSYQSPGSSQQKPGGLFQNTGSSYQNFPFLPQQGNNSSQASTPTVFANSPTTSLWSNDQIWFNRRPKN